MNFQFHQIITCIFLSSLAHNVNSSYCANQICGEHRVPYPFGFSLGCQIKLNCSAAANIQLGDFLVLNLTSDQILISVPAKCNRPITKFRELFRRNVAPLSRNGLLFDQCRTPQNDCRVPKVLMGSKSDESCSSRKKNGGGYNISCFASGLFDGMNRILDYQELASVWNCSYLLSSYIVDLNENEGGVNGSSPIFLQNQMMELGWWVDKGHKCHPNATRTTVEKGGTLQGVRCKCKEGYTGDGFVAGEGCKRVLSIGNCRAPRYLPVRCGEVSLAILIGVIASASAGAAAIVVCLCIKRRSKSLKGGLSAKHLLSEAAGSSNIPFYTYKEIERATNCFAEKQRLGTGAYGTVYAGKLHDGQRVAIKKLRHQDYESAEQVMNEMKLLSSVSHPNSVRLLGCCIDNGQQILIYEFMPNGTLAQHLKRRRGTVLPWTIRLDIAAETAHAIAHLHSAMNPPIYHRDVKSSNILLDDNFKSKVADFGLSRYGMVDDSHVSTAPQGTPGYVDPQYHQNYHLSDKSDVYSFGVVLVEIITALKVVDFSRPHSEINLAELAIDRIRKGCVDEIIDPFLEPNRDAWTLWSVHKVAELAFRCLAFHSETRPSMMEVGDELEQIRVSGWAPWEDNGYTASPLPSSSCSSSSSSTANKDQHAGSPSTDSYSGKLASFRHYHALNNKISE